MIDELIIKSIPLIHNGWRYYHSEITTSPFGGRTIEMNHQKHNVITKIILPITDWGKEMMIIMNEMGEDKFNNTIWDLDYDNPFIDYR